MLPEVEALHILVDETERMCLSRVNPHKRYYAHVSTVEEAVYVNLIGKPLRDIISVPPGMQLGNIPRRLEQH